MNVREKDELGRQVHGSFQLRGWRRELDRLQARPGGAVPDLDLRVTVGTWKKVKRQIP